MSDFNRPQIPKPTSTGSFNNGRAVGLEAASQARLIVKAYGLQALQTRLYQISDSETLRKQAEARDEGNKNKALSYFGLPVFAPLTFAKKTWKTLKNEQIDIPELNLGIALIEIGMTKKIVETSVQGRTETVKEFISNNSFNVTIRGVIASNAIDYYPRDEVNHLRDFLLCEESIEVGSQFLNDFGITDIVVTDFTLPMEEGKRSVQKFEIQARSDKPFELKIQS